MKTTFLTLLLGLVVLAHGQEWPDLPSKDSSGQQEFVFAVTGNSAEIILNIEQLSAPIKIQGIRGSEIKIIADDYDGLPEKAKGLRPLSAAGPENTGIGLSISQEGNRISLSGAHKEADEAHYYISVPKNMMLKIDYTGWQVEDVEIFRMEGEIEAKSNIGDLIFVDVTGPIVAHTLSSEIEVTFSTLSQDYPSSITSTSGDIDVSLSATSKGLFRMSTISGGVYTDLDFDLAGGNMRSIAGQKVQGKLNGGGVEVLLKTISGDVYVRESK